MRVYIMSTEPKTTPQLNIPDVKMSVNVPDGIAFSVVDYFDNAGNRYTRDPLVNGAVYESEENAVYIKAT